VLLAASLFAVLAGIFLARRMVGPIQALRAGAARIGGGDFSQRISIKTGDELEGLADQFNDMGARLQESYADLENKVEQRTSELKESLEQQTATADVLKVISNSSGDLQPVFDAMLANATKICGAKFGMMWLIEGTAARCVALHNAPPAFADLRKREPVIHPGPSTAMGRLLKTRQVVHIEDAMAEQAYVEGDPVRRANTDLAGARTIVAVPMLKDNEVIGAIGIFHQKVQPFTEKQIDLVTNFANQAVIAIENARLLNELRKRTTELSKSLDELRTAQDRLIQTEKLASLGQLTAGIAHEIKNPLNFVNNFSALSTELIDELNDVLKTAALDDKTREEVDELTHMLKGNLEKVVQHGKRADSIVKNMLLHSREGSGERRPADINAIVEESLNLAYHGARAEKSGFNIALERDLDPQAGMVDLYPQEITRVFLNLISNGFYAATKRKAAGEAGFEPTLRATTRNLGNRVEIRIRDNGTGIPKGVREKMFNPFFTTKPAGEGTGLGLSMSHDIVVKQHGGRIEVETAPGAFTEFIITLPRTLAAQESTGGRN
jgi:signal transduction histidine kinase